MKKTAVTKKVVPKKLGIKKDNKKDSKIVVKKLVTKKPTAKKAVMKKSALLLVGSQVPRFALPSSNGDVISSAGLLGSRYVLYFYPKDETSGCTVEANEFTELGKKFATSGVQIFGVSPDTIASHIQFIEKDKISFPLLADVGHAVAELFGVWVTKSMYGKKYMGIERATFVIDKTGKIESTYRNVKAGGHAVCVLEDLSK